MTLVNRQPLTADPTAPPAADVPVHVRVTLMVKPYLLVIPLLLLAFWLGVREFSANSIWIDEWHSIYDAGGAFYGPLSPAGIWNRVANRNPWHTPGFFMTLSVWGGWVGWRPEPLRLLSALFGLLVMAWTYRLGRDAVSPLTGLFAVGMLATAAFFANFLHEIRVYMLFSLFTVFLFWFYWRLISRRRTPTPLELLALLLVTASFLYQHYFSVLPLAVIGLYHLFLALRRIGFKPTAATAGRAFWRRWWGISAAVIGGGVLFVPWLGVFVEGLRRTTGDTRLHERALSTGESVFTLVNLFSHGVIALLVVLVLAGVALLIRSRDADQRGAWTLLYFGGALALAFLLFNTVLPIMHDGRLRYLLSLWAPLALAVAVCLTQIARLPGRFAAPGRWLAGGIIGGWMLFGLYNIVIVDFVRGLDDSLFQFPAHKLSAQLRDDLTPDDIVTVYLPEGAAPAPYRRIVSYYFDDFPANFHYPNYKFDEDTTGYGRVWVAYSPQNPRRAQEHRDDVYAKLDAEFDYCGVHHETVDLRIDRHLREPGCCPAGATPDAALMTFGAGIAVAGVGTLPAQVERWLPVNLAWSVADTVVWQDYSVTLNVLDASGAKVAQADYGLEAGYECDWQDIDVSHLPTGDYSVQVGVYPWQTGTRIVGTLTSTGEQGDLLPVGAFAITRDDS